MSEKVQQVATGFLGFLAWAFTALAAVDFIAVIAIFIENKPKDEGARIGLILFFFMLGIPGALLMRKYRKMRSAINLRLNLMGLFESHEKLTVAKVSAICSIPVAAAHSEMMRLMAEGRYDFVEIGSGVFLRRTLLDAGVKILDRCQNCGAPFGNSILITGERCSHCGTVQLNK